MEILNFKKFGSLLQLIREPLILIRQENNIKLMPIKPKGGL